MLANRLRKKRRLCERWAKRESTDCYRLYDRDIPELPFAIDAYAGYLHASAYRRPDLDPVWARHVVLSAARELEVPAEKVALKVRERMKGTRQYERQGQRGERLVVHERGHRFYVNLWDYLDTGLFLDHRLTRSLVEAEARGKRFLNLYSYTGSFGVYAAKGGAEQVVQVDLSRTYLDWGRDNLELNGLLSKEHAFVLQDALVFLEQAAQRRERFDLVVADPPTFSNSKRMDGTFDVRRDHAELLSRVLEVLAPGGVMYFSTNAKHFRLEEEAVAARIEDITERTRAPDFEGRHSHRAWRIAR